MTQLAYYVDRQGTLGKLERTPQGGYRVPATIARAGVMSYTADSLRKQGLSLPEGLTGIVKIYMPAEVLQAAADSLRDAPVTNEHPPEMVNPSNFQRYAAGTVSASSVEFDGKFLKGNVVVQDAKLLADIESGKRREVSAGYRAGTKFEPGITPEGEAYDAIRTVAEYNHAAIVTAGRAGDQVCLALDSTEIPGAKQVTIKINGIEVAEGGVQAAVDTLEGHLAAKTAELEALKAKLAATESALVVADSDETFEAKLAARKAAEAAAAARTEKLTKVKSAYPTIALDGKSDEYIDGLFAAISADPDGLDELTGKTQTAPVKDAAQKPKVKKLTGRAKMLADNRALFNEKP